MRRRLKADTPTKEATASLFRKLKIFEKFSESELHRVSLRTKLLRIERTRNIIVDGEATPSLYLLVSGVVKVSAMNAEAHPVLMGVVLPGEIFGLHSLLAEPVHRFRCDAFTECTIAQFPARMLCEILLPRVPFDTFRLIIQMSLGRWWWGLPVWYSRMARLSVRERVIAMLGELSRKFGVTDSRGTIITLPLSRDALAELIGASRQTVSEEIEKLVRNGTLIRDGRRLLLTTVRARLSNSAQARRS